MRPGWFIRAGKIYKGPLGFSYPEWAMFTNDKLSPPGGEVPAPHPPASPAGQDALEAAARQLVEAIAAEPVPERLRALALALGAALDRQRGTGEPSPDPEDRDGLS